MIRQFARPIAALGVMMRQTGNDDARKPGHAMWWRVTAGFSIECTAIE